MNKLIISIKRFLHLDIKLVIIHSLDLTEEFFSTKTDYYFKFRILDAQI